jgi:hypothetical protein
MNIYRLAAIAPGDPSWRLSNEKETVWACAPDVGSARAMVAARTFVIEPDRQGDKAPWEDEEVTSCILDPTMSLMRAGTVVRQDGSAVGERP